jgi:hypothetical protein
MDMKLNRPRWYTFLCGFFVLAYLSLVVITAVLSLRHASRAGHSSLSDMTTIHSSGTYKFPGSGATVTLTEPSLGALTVRYGYDKPNGYLASTSGPFKVDPTNWLAVFVAPNELWIYDGLDTVRLEERTTKGFKGTSSNIKASLLKRAPLPIADALAKRSSK